MKKFAKVGCLPDFVAELENAAANEPKKAEEQSNIVQLFPVCSSSKRLMPSPMLRSALFGIVRRGRRGFINDSLIASQEGTEIKYTGEQLMQSDQDIWMACVELCKQQQATTIKASRSDILRLAGRKGGDTKRIWRDLMRLRTATIEINNGKQRYGGGLLHEVAEDDESKLVLISLNPKMLDLFGGNVTHLGIEQRKALKTDISKWLQGFVCSHKSSAKNQSRISLSKLQELCGSTSEKRKFRQQIRAAANELKTMYILAGWKLERDVLTYYKPPTI